MVTPTVNETPHHLVGGELAKSLQNKHRAIYSQSFKNASVLDSLTPPWDSRKIQYAKRCMGVFAAASFVILEQRCNQQWGNV